MINISKFIACLNAGLIAVIIGVASSIALIYQVVITLGGTSQMVASWLLILGLAMGVISIITSIYYKVPILIAWSTPGAALLIASGGGFNLNEAVGAFIFSAVMIWISGVTGWFEKLMNKVPSEIASALLAGILVNFCLAIFNVFSDDYVLFGAMFLSYLVGRLIMPTYTMLMVLVVGVWVAFSQGQIEASHIQWTVSEIRYISPEFSLSAILSLGIPLFIVTMFSQNLPGVAVLKAHQYKAPISKVLTTTGWVNVLIAPFGGFAINLAAITAAICMSEEIDKRPEKRYWGAVSAGGFYIVMALMAGTIVSVFDALPASFITALAGIALLSTLTASLSQALSKSKINEAAIMTFLIAASSFEVFGIGSALWACIVGSVFLMLTNLKVKLSQSLVNKLKRDFL